MKIKENRKRGENTRDRLETQSKNAGLAGF
jgi:hypothetical protein